ncbi:Cof-type HAD-IIB family hydrolase [Mycoplasmopsis gallinacea]|uniref:COF family HAD hydrolase protein n=1 Tax=Mycoplasmopsis gallinacea TaxID=29556 RepID=A0A449A393_9BACT|nr:HAD family hydrolase [Mycoplasmopsis gallinacea]VEU58740.1 COF family HAD hydrolase protein [Mycoplasmopsis gallinacea]
MKKPEIIFVDLDATLLDSKDNYTKVPSKENLEAIERAKKAGIKVVVSTGRGINHETEYIVSKVGDLNYIAWNGAQIIHHNKLIKNFAIEKSVMQDLFNELDKAKASFILNSDPVNHAYVRNIFMKAIMIFTKFTGKPLSDFKNDLDVFKVLVWSPSRKKVHRLWKELSKKFEGKLNVALSGHKDHALEITAPEATKGDAEVFYCNFLGINPQNAIHIGDSGNDATTQGKIGKAVALGNSVKRYKEIADEIFEHHYKDAAVGLYINKLLDKLERSK